MCQRLLVGYRTCSYLCPCHALHGNTLGWLIFGEIVEFFYTLAAGGGGGGEGDLWCCGGLIIMLV